MQRVLSLLLAAGSLLNLAAPSRADYPIASHRYLADPSTLVTDDRVYVYCSNDDESPLEGSYNIPSVVCVSSGDLKNWTDHGEVFRAEDRTTWAKKTWAPAAIERDGKFYLYFGNGGANIGVAVADHPAGPFTDPLGKPLITHQTPGVHPAKNMWLFDPGVFIDDDGQAYIYFGGNGDDNVRVARLNPDMTSLDGEVMKRSAPNFFEAAWVFKHGGRYYFSYSTTPKAQMRIDYLTGENPLGPFEYAGVVGAQPPLNNNNNHAAQFKLKDRWLHVYHNRVVATEAKIPTGFRRNIAVEEMRFGPDGAIEEVEYTVDGVEQLGSHDPYARTEGETFRSQHGVETAPSGKRNMALTDLQDGDWVMIAGVDFGGGAARFNARVASKSGCRIELRAGGPEGKLLGTLTVEPDGADEWRDASCEVSGASGKQDLVLRFAGGGEQLGKLDYWSFQE